MYGSGMNTGAAYMARRGWDKDPSSQGSISFHGSSRKKIFVIIALALLGFLLIGAVIIIILFAVGVIPTSPSNPPNATFQPLPGVTLRVQGPLIYRCSFVIQRQAQSAYDEVGSSTYQYALAVMTAALTDTIRQSTLASLGPTVEITNLTNRGNDLQVDFQLRLQSSVDRQTVRSVIVAQIPTLRTRLQPGGNNLQIDNVTVY